MVFKKIDKLRLKAAKRRQKNTKFKLAKIKQDTAIARAEADLAAQQARKRTARNKGKMPLAVKSPSKKRKKRSVLPTAKQVRNLSSNTFEDDLDLVGRSNTRNIPFADNMMDSNLPPAFQQKNRSKKRDPFDFF